MIKQVAVFLENKAGKASACCKVLKDAGVNLLALSIADTQDFGILRLITENNEKALSALKGAGYIASEVELVGGEQKDGVWLHDIVSFGSMLERMCRL